LVITRVTPTPTLTLNRNPNQAYDKVTLGAKCVKADPNPNPSPDPNPNPNPSVSPNPNPSRCVKGDPVDMSNAFQRQLRKVRVSVRCEGAGVGEGWGWFQRQLRKQGKDYGLRLKVSARAG